MALRQEKKIKVIKTGKENLSIFIADNMIYVYTLKNPLDSNQKTLRSNKLSSKLQDIKSIHKNQ